MEAQLTTEPDALPQDEAARAHAAPPPASTSLPPPPEAPPRATSSTGSLKLRLFVQRSVGSAVVDRVTGIAAAPTVTPVATSVPAAEAVPPPPQAAGGPPRPRQQLHVVTPAAVADLAPASLEVQQPATSPASADVVSTAAEAGRPRRDARKRRRYGDTSSDEVEGAEEEEAGAIVAAPHVTASPATAAANAAITAAQPQLLFASLLSSMFSAVTASSSAGGAAALLPALQIPPLGFGFGGSSAAAPPPSSRKRRGAASTTTRDGSDTDGSAFEAPASKRRRVGAAAAAVTSTKGSRGKSAASPESRPPPTPAEAAAAAAARRRGRLLSGMYTLKELTETWPPSQRGASAMALMPPGVSITTITSSLPWRKSAGFQIACPCCQVSREAALEALEPDLEAALAAIEGAQLATSTATSQEAAIAVDVLRAWGKGLDVTPLFAAAGNGGDRTARSGGSTSVSGAGSVPVTPAASLSPEALEALASRAGELLRARLSRDLYARRAAVLVNSAAYTIHVLVNRGELKKKAVVKYGGSGKASTPQRTSGRVAARAAGGRRGDEQDGSGDSSAGSGSDSDGDGNAEAEGTTAAATPAASPSSSAPPSPAAPGPSSPAPYRPYRIHFVDVAALVPMPDTLEVEAVARRTPAAASTSAGGEATAASTPGATAAAAASSGGASAAGGAHASVPAPRASRAHLARAASTEGSGTSASGGVVASSSGGSVEVASYDPSPAVRPWSPMVNTSALPATPLSTSQTLAHGGFTDRAALEFFLRTGYTAPVTVTVDPSRGRCVLAAAFLPRGTFVAEYAGQLIHADEAVKREGEYADAEDEAIGSYMFFFAHAVDVEAVVAAAEAEAEEQEEDEEGGSSGADSDSDGEGRRRRRKKKAAAKRNRAPAITVDDAARHCIDATAERVDYGIGRLINHSRKAPNLAVRKLLVDGVPRLALITKREVHYGEELLYDYGERDKDVLRNLAWLQKT